MIEVCGNYSIPILTAPEKEEFMQVMIIQKIYFQNSKNNTDTAHLNEKVMNVS